MTTLTDTPPPVAAAHAPAGAGLDLLGWLATTDHKRIGIMYGIAALGFFLAAGVMALVMRAELAVPGLQLVTAQASTSLFAIHGTAMTLLRATPMVGASASCCTPLQVGAADMVCL